MIPAPELSLGQEKSQERLALAPTGMSVNGTTPQKIGMTAQRRVFVDTRGLYRSDGYRLGDGFFLRTVIGRSYGANLPASISAGNDQERVVLL
jgi:hypothetical protein